MLAKSSLILGPLCLIHTAFAQASTDFSKCTQFFAKAKSPIVKPQPKLRALSFDAFTVLHSGVRKTPVYMAQKLSRESVADADEKRRDKFYEEGCLPYGKRATLSDYKVTRTNGACGRYADSLRNGAKLLFGQHGPSSDQTQRRGMGQHRREATRHYASKARGNVYVVTGPVFDSNLTIGAGQVAVPTYLFKLVYDEERNVAWAHWHANSDETRGSKPVSYAELVKRTGVEFLPGLTLKP